MGPGRDRTRDPWMCSQTRICSQTRYRLRYAARSIIIQGMYANTQSFVPVQDGYSQEVKGSVLSPLLIIVLEALSCKFCSGLPREDFYVDDLVIIADSLEECVRSLLICKKVVEEKVLRVNVGKTKVKIYSTAWTSCRVQVSSNVLSVVQE